MTTNKKVTSKKVGTDSSKEMKSSKKIIRSIAGSGVSQVDPKKETGKKVSSKAGKTLRNPNSTKKEKEIAGSVLSQTPGKKKNKKLKK